jgi:tripartite motif-containing protein 71
LSRIISFRLFKERTFCYILEGIVLNTNMGGFRVRRTTVITVFLLTVLGFFVLTSRGRIEAETPGAAKYICAGVWGSRGSDDGEFIDPAGIAVALDGTVYVVDSSNYRIQYFTSNGSFLGKWGSKGEEAGEFVSPEGIGVSPQGDVYVTDIKTNRVQCFTSTGSYLREWRFESAEPGQYWEGESPDTPVAIEVSPNGHVYVVGDMSGEIREYTPTGSLIREWGYMGYWGPGEPGWYAGALPPAGSLWLPYGIAVAPNGDVYVADTGSDRVQYFSPTSYFKGMWGETGRGQGEFRWPGSITVSNNGDVYVADQLNARVQLFSASGSYVTEWGVEGYGKGEFTGLSDVAVGPDGAVYTTESRVHRVQIFTNASRETQR